MVFAKRQLPVLIAFAFGLGLWMQYFVPARWSQTALEQFAGSWAVIIAAAALVLGVLSAVHYHSNKIKLKKPGWAYSVITLAAFGVTAFVGLAPIDWPYFTQTAKQDHSPLLWIFTYVFFPLDATVFALLAFFIASAAFRAFRARTLEATLLLIAGILMMIGRVPIGEMLTVVPEDLAQQLGAEGRVTIQGVSSWLFNVPNAAAQRGILLGVFLSQVAISLRIIFGIERTYMGGGEE